MKNIFEIFDTMSTGRVNQNEILWVFSMGMNGTGKDTIAECSDARHMVAIVGI